MCFCVLFRVTKCQQFQIKFYAVISFFTLYTRRRLSSAQHNSKSKTSPFALKKVNKTKRSDIYYFLTIAKKKNIKTDFFPGYAEK